MKPPVIKIILPLLLLLFGTQSRAQEILERYVAMGMESNLALQQEDINHAHSLSLLREARSYYLPQISFEASYTLAEGGRTINFPAGDLFNPIYGTLNQLTGTEQFPTDLQNLNEQLLPNDFHDTRLQLRQAILNTDALYGIRAREAQVAMQAATREAYAAELRHDIRTAYWQYMQAHTAVDIYLEASQLLSELLRVNLSLYANHKVTIDKVYRAEMELSAIEAQIAEARNKERQAANYFNFLLNRDLNTPIEAEEGPARADTAEELLSAQAGEKRKELIALDHGLRASDALRRKAEGFRIPDIGLGLQAGYQGFGYSFDGNQDYVLMQVNLSWSLFGGFGNLARIQQAALASQKLESQQEQVRQQIGMQVSNAQQALLSARAGWQSRQAAAKSAEHNFRLMKRMYEEGQALLVEYIDARQQLSSSKLQAQIAWYQILIAQNKLNFALGNS